MTGAEITARLKAEAKALGFELAGACPAVAPDGVSKFFEWLNLGYAGEMDYLARRRDAYAHPEGVLPGARSLLVLAMNYRTTEPGPPKPGFGRVARYAWGAADYHDLIHDRLEQLKQLLVRLAPGCAVRGVVDTAPLLEREFAVLAGLGWIGKNTLVLNQRLGSWFFLAVLLTDVELAYDEPSQTDHCGTCRACLDACPTGAFVDAYVLDARRCLSYTTIEQRTLPGEELRRAQGDWLFGCDICQEVCPWNRRAPATDEPAFAPDPETEPIELARLFDLDEAAFRRQFRHTPLWRPKRRGILRNAALALGSQRYLPATGALMRGLADAEPLVRAACAWALGQYATAAARLALAERRKQEPVEEVQREIDAALGVTGTATGTAY
ncbi:MAG: tRNA epoxyqueuosine(34) reductase QueG [Pirellulales bacterium]